jgi:glycosyltransferase involved in cell wall biosynthesis
MYYVADWIWKGNHKMRVAIVTQTYSRGNGQASFTIQLAESLVKSGHQVMVITPADRMKSSSCVQNEVRVERVSALHLAILHPMIYITPLPALRVKELFREFQPEVVHIQDHYFLCAAAVNEARRMRVPVIGTNHFLPENLLPFVKNLPRLQHLLSIPLWKMMLAVFNKLDLATTPSQTAARILRGQRIRIPVHAISNGVDTNRFRPDPETDRVGIRQKYNLAPDRTLFLYVGRLDGEKRLDTLLDAVSLLPRADLQLAIAGYGLSEQALRRQVQALGLEGRVTFIGFVQAEDLPSLYNSADIFVMPSPEELQSIATLEAMACGKPILAADARALPELVQPGVNGYLFQACNAKDAARQMEKLLKERDTWQAMGQASFERVQRHSLQNTIQHFEEHYGTITGKIQVKRRKATATRSVVNKSI